MIDFNTILVKDSKNFDKIINITKNELLKKGILKITSISEKLGLALYDYLEINLGKLSTNDITATDIDQKYHRVEVSKEIILDKFGFQPYSTTDKSLPCHTDDFFNKKPTDTILFYCVRQDIDGGKTLLSSLKDILLLLSNNDIKLLQKDIFPTYYGTTSILFKNNNKFIIKYNRTILDKAINSKNILSTKVMRCIEKLDFIIEKSTYTTKLLPKDILIINNNTILHGRTKIMKNTNRLLYRKKIYSHELCS